MKLPKKLHPLKLIRKNCLDCCGNSSITVQFCASTDCHLWYLRFGKRPKTFIKMKGKKFESLFDKENFKKGGKYDPDILIEEMEV